jgi:hypothetical protein
VHQFFFTEGRSLYILVIDLTAVLHLHGAELRQEVMKRMKFWVESLQARAPGAVVKIVLTKGDSVPAEGCKALLKAREVVWSCIEELVTGSLDVLRTELDNLEDSAGGRGATGKERLAELRAAIESGGLRFPESDPEILVVGIPPGASRNAEGVDGQIQEAEAGWDDPPDESEWKNMLKESESMQAVSAPLHGLSAMSEGSSSRPESEQLFTTATALQAVLVDLAEANEMFTIPLPANWVKLMDWADGRQQGFSLSEHATTGSIEWSEYAQELCGKGKLFSSEKSLRQATEMLHELGYLLYYGGDGDLGKYVFMHPQKVINLLKVVVQHNFEDKVRYAAINNRIRMNLGGSDLFRQLTSKFLEEGKLDHRMLPQMWPKIGEWSLFKALLELLERFDLAYCPEVTISNKESNTQWGSHGVPSRWPEAPKQSLAAMLPLKGTPIVCRRLHFDRLLPEGIFEQLLVRCLGLDGLTLDEGRKALWRSTEAWGSGACFDCEGEVCMLLLMTRDPASSSESSTVSGGGGEMPGYIFVLSWKSRESTGLEGEGSARATGAVQKLLTELGPLLHVRYPGARFQEEVICHDYNWHQGLSDDYLLGAAAGQQLEADSALSFQEVVSSIRNSGRWRSLQERKKQWQCKTCPNVHLISTFGKRQVSYRSPN